MKKRRNPSSTPIESPIMFNCSMCGSKTDSSRSRHNQSPKHEQIEEGNGFNPIPTPTPTPSPFSDSCSVCGSKKQRFLTPKEEASSVKSPEKAAAAAIPNQKSKSNVSYFGRTSCSDSLHLPKSSTPTTRDQKYCKQIVEKGCFDGVSKSSTAVVLVQKSQSQLSGQIVEKGCFDGVSKSSTAVVLVQKSQSQLSGQIVEKNIGGLLNLSLDLLFPYLPIEDAAKLPVICQSLLNQFSSTHPTFIDSNIIKSREPLWLNIDSQRIENSFSVFLSGRELKRILYFFMAGFLKAHSKASILWFTGGAGSVVSESLLSLQRSIIYEKFTLLKSLRLYKVDIREIILRKSVEEVELISCRLPDVFFLKSEAKWELKSLTMKLCVGVSGSLSQIILWIPTLLDFRFYGTVCKLEVSRCIKLSEADIRFQSVPSNLRSDLVFQFLNSLKGVQSLTICPICVNVRETSLWLPKVTKLGLTLSLKDKKDAEQLNTMLMRVPVLQELSVQIDQSWLFCSGFWTSHPIVLDRLTSFKMGPLKGTPAEREFIGRVLLSARMLKKAELFLFLGVQSPATAKNIRGKERQRKAIQNAIRVEQMMISLPRSSLQAVVTVAFLEDSKVEEACRMTRTTKEIKSESDTFEEDLNSVADSRTLKILSYNVCFREDLEMYRRMKAIGDLIEQHSPDVICFQEITPAIYDIFQQASWWKVYRCSLSKERARHRTYFCMQLSKLPVKSFKCEPFSNSVMGRELCLTEIDLRENKQLVVATSHLESPCPAPPTWNQMFSKERVAQAKEAIIVLKDSPNVILCGDMSWDDKLDGQFPLPDGWVDAWSELRPGEVGYTYDTKSNQMLSGNQASQKRLDRFLCGLRDFKISEIHMIGLEAIPDLSYFKEKRTKKELKKLQLPVLPSDHYGLLLTIYDK